MNYTSLLTRVIQITLALCISALFIGEDVNANTILNYEGNSLDFGTSGFFVTLELLGDNLTDILVDEDEVTQNKVVDFDIGFLDQPETSRVNINNADFWSIYLDLVGGEVIEWNINAGYSNFVEGIGEVSSQFNTANLSGVDVQDYFRAAAGFFFADWNNDNPGVWSVGSVAPVPEPSTFLLLGGGLAGLAFYARRRRKEE